MRSPRRTEDVGLRILLLAALVFVVLPAISLGIYFLGLLFEQPRDPRRRHVTPLERAFTRLRQPRDDAEMPRAKDEAEREQARAEALRVLRQACADEAKPAADLIRTLQALRRLCAGRSEHARACRRLEFGQCVRLLREGRQEEALSRIWHLGDPDGIEPDYDHVWIHLQSERYDEAVNVAAEAVAAREKAGVPDLVPHLKFYAWLLKNAGRFDDAKAVEERLSRLAVDPAPPREPEREEQAANDARPR